MTVIILNYNGGQYTSNCIASVLDGSYEGLKVILVDNGSTDGSLEAAELKFGSRMFTMRNPRNLGYGSANNAGAELAETEYLAFLHNDAVADPRWLEEAVAVLDADPTIGAAQSLVEHTAVASPPLLGGLISYFTLLANPPVLLSSSDPTPREIGFSVGVASIVRRDLFGRVGRFDSEYFLSNEDLDLGWRIWLSGYRVVGVPKSVVHHRGGVGGDQLGGLVGILHFRSSLVTMLKNLALRNVLLIVPASLLFYMIYALGQLVLYGDRKVFLSKMLAMKGVFWAIANLKAIWKKRNFVQRKVRKVSNDRFLASIAKRNGMPESLVTRPLPYWIIRRLDTPI